MKLRKLITAIAVLVFSAVWMLNSSAALAAQTGQIILPGTDKEGKALTNPYNQPAVLTLNSQGKWNFRQKVTFSIVDGDGYPKGVCPSGPDGCPAPDLVPGRLLTLDYNSKDVLDSGKEQTVELAPNQNVILVMNDDRAYANNSGYVTIYYSIDKKENL